MGRRRLPKLDPAVDYSRHLYELDAVQPGLLAPALFDIQQPLEIEIGSGKGLFLLNQSAAQPNHNYIGIEIAKKYARFAAYRLAKFARNNARVIRGDGLAFCREHVADQSVTAYHVYFPDPWWKDRHRRRRVIQTDFIHSAQRTLVPGGKLIFWTDVEEYYESGCEQIQNESNFAGPFPDIAAAVTQVLTPQSNLVELAEDYASVPTQPEHPYPAKVFSSELQDASPSPIDLAEGLNGQDIQLATGRTHFDRRMLRNDHEVFRCFFLKPGANV